MVLERIENRLRRAELALDTFYSRPKACAWPGCLSESTWHHNGKRAKYCKYHLNRLPRRTYFKREG
jgi:hypothetical protein